jgi:hypothetical protein
VLLIVASVAALVVVSAATFLCSRRRRSRATRWATTWSSVLLFHLTTQRYFLIS